MNAPSWLPHRRSLERGLLHTTGGVLVAFLLLPLLGLVLTTSLRDFLAGLAHPLVWPALRLSVFTTLCSLVLVVVFGTPLAWSVARSRTRLARVVESAVELPIVIPPAVAGVAMLIVFGRHGLLAEWLYPPGFGVSFTTAAVVMAEVFVSAPFFVQAAISAFRRIEEDFVVVARTLGASPLRIFFRLAIPLAAQGLFAGATLSWARSLGEFGATLMFAGNLQGRTQTLPLAIYTTLESDLRAARTLSVLLVVSALFLLLAARAALRRTELPTPVPR
jgi:molybdate transport system permease protein